MTGMLRLLSSAFAGRFLVSVARWTVVNGQELPVLKVAGSSTVRPVVELWAATSEMQALFTFEIEGGGSSNGARRVCLDEVDAEYVFIGDMSRDWKDAEGTFREDGYTIDCATSENVVTQITVGSDVLVVTVGTGSSAYNCLTNPTIGGMTLAELRWAFSDWTTAQLQADGVDVSFLGNDDGDGVREWSDLHAACDEVPINPYGPTSAHGTYEFFGETVFCKDCFSEKDGYIPEYFRSCSDDTVTDGEGSTVHRIETMNETDYATWLAVDRATDGANCYVPTDDSELLLKALGTDPGAISYAGYAIYASNSVELTPVRVAKDKVLGITSTLETAQEVTIYTLKDGTYDVFLRYLYMNVHHDSWDVVRPFMSYGLSFEGQQHVLSASYLSLNSVLLAEQNLIIENPGAGSTIHVLMNCPSSTGLVEEEVIDDFGFSAFVSVCMPCEPGTAKDNNLATPCSACPIGYFTSESGSVVCDVCPQGRMALEGSSMCVLCSEVISAASESDALLVSSCYASVDLADRPLLSLGVSDLIALETLDIMVPIPLTGSFAPGRTLGISAELALDLINTQQLILPGYRLQAYSFDDTCTPDYASRAVMNTLANSDQWIASVGMACSDVCAQVAPILSALRLPSVASGCNARALDDADLFPHFLQLETQSDSVDAVEAVLASDAFSDPPTRIVVFSGSDIFAHVAEYFAQLSRSLDVTSVTSSSEDIEDIIQIITSLADTKHRLVLVVGREQFWRKVICASEVARVTKGMTWIFTGAQRASWWSENDPDLLAVQPECSGTVITEYVQGAITISDHGRPIGDQGSDLLSCLYGYTADSFAVLVGDYWSSGYPLNSGAGGTAGNVSDFQSFVAYGVDGVCIVAYMLQHMLAEGYSVEDLRQPTQEIFDEMISFLRGGTSFSGVSGQVVFEGNTKPGTLAIGQITGDAHRWVGSFNNWSGTVDLALNGGLSNQSWSPAPEVAEDHSGFPVLWIQVGVPVLVCTMPLMFAGCWQLVGRRMQSWSGARLG